MRPRVLAALTAAVFLIALITASAALAAEPYTLDVARKLVGLSSPRVSPDGRSIAYLVSKPDHEANRNLTELWIADAATGETHPLTFERRSVSAPAWSPDGATLAFLAPRREGQGARSGCCRCARANRDD
jgi:dipeptidyl aminopeptidase/acylaminoacyl peptidase